MHTSLLGELECNAVVLCEYKYARWAKFEIMQKMRWPTADSEGIASESGVETTHVDLDARMIDSGSALVSERYRKSDHIFYAVRAENSEDWKEEKHAWGIATHLESVVWKPVSRSRSLSKGVRVSWAPWSQSTDSRIAQIALWFFAMYFCISVK